MQAHAPARACVPSALLPSTQPPASHSDGMRLIRHMAHLPHDVTAATTTLSPSRKCSTAAPVSTTCHGLENK